MMGRRLWRAAVAVLTAVGLALRLYALAADPLSTDELITRRFIMQYSAVELWWAIPMDQPHVPLYYSLLRTWAWLGGFSPAWLRGFSALAGAASVTLVAGLTARLDARESGLLAALLVAVAPMLVAQGQYLRMYSLLVALVAASWWALLRALDGDGRRATWAVMALVCALTHVFGGLVVAGQALVGLHADRRRWAGPVATVALAVAPLAVLLGLRAVGAIQPGGGMAHPNGLHLETAPGPAAIVATATTLLTPRHATLGTAQLTTAGALVGVVGWGVLDRRGRRVGLAWVSVPAGVALLVSHAWRPLWSPRYLVVVAPALCIGIAVIGHRYGRASTVLVVGVIAALTLSLGAVYAAPLPQADAGDRARASYQELVLDRGCAESVGGRPLGTNWVDPSDARLCSMGVLPEISMRGPWQTCPAARTDCRTRN